MYVTRPLSLYKASPEAASAPPLENPHGGYLVVLDEEYEEQATRCWGLCKNRYIGDPPFPQNRVLTVEYTTVVVDNQTGVGQTQRTSSYDVFFFPVPGLPLSSNRYYVVRAQGKHAGKVCACSKEEDKSTCCFCSCVSDVKPRPFDHRDLYQQVEIVPRRSNRGKFYARAVAPDGFPPHFLRRKGWEVYTSRSRKLSLDLPAASGVDGARRVRMPDTTFPLPAPCSAAVAVGKWHVPFIFVKEDSRPKEQMKRSVFYEVSLEQFWEAVHACDSPPGELRSAVHVRADLRTETALLRGREPVEEEGMRHAVDGAVWFRPGKAAGGEAGVGLSTAVVEGMRWEEERWGWRGGKAMVERVEEYRGGAWGWGRFGCYVLVERFTVRRMDGGLVLTYDFRHVDKIITKWE